jgi:fructose-1,6-bisphosphatase I
MEISRASKYVAHAIRTGDLGKCGTANTHGEDQLALDVLSDQIFCNVLSESDLVASFASEEQEEQVSINGENGAYSVAFDPLDGSSLVDVNISVGSIFGVWQGNGFVGKTGADMKAAGYFQYGPRTSFVLAIGGKTVEFVLNELGEYHLSQGDLKISDEAKIFAPGNLRAIAERPEYKRVLDYFLVNQKTLRYAGGMVPDINSIFMKGQGIFTYPSHSKYPSGKLRLLYECAPMAYLVSAAGGKAVDEKGEPILAIACKDLHQRTSIFLGSRNDVNTTVKLLNE